MSVVQAFISSPKDSQKNLCTFPQHLAFATRINDRPTGLTLLKSPQWLLPQDRLQL